MKTYTEVEASKGFSALQINSYPGRGFVVGVDESGKNIVQIYFLTGRSENSRNRVFSVDGARVFTEPADPSKVKDPSLIIYNAMTDNEYVSIVSNGHQTDTVAEHYNGENGGVEDILAEWQYEPDHPNYTPRITAICHWAEFTPYFQLALLRKATDSQSCERFFARYPDLPSGSGVSLTTYAGDGDPLPPFRGEPRIMPVVGDIDKNLELYWDALNSDNRISLAVKFTSVDHPKHPDIKIINKYEKVK